MNVSAQLTRNSGLRVRVNRKVTTTATDNNKQGDVQAMEFSIPGYNDLVWDVSLVYDRISSSSVTTLMLGLASRLIDTDVITLSRTLLLHLRSYLSLARFTLNFYVSCG